MGEPISVLWGVGERWATYRGVMVAGCWNQHREMPAISAFYGILIRMFFNDHPPPHFHARYGEFEATIEIATLNILEGALPARALNLVAGMGDDA